MTTTENIAKVFHDLRTGKFTTDRYLWERRHEGELSPAENLRRLFASAQSSTPIVDATFIYHQLLSDVTEVDIYGDHPCLAPPYDRMLVTYENEHGNVLFFLTMTTQRPKDMTGPPEMDSKEEQLFRRKLDEAPLQWDDVRWITQSYVFVGGRGTDGPAPTTGPLVEFNYALDADGAPLHIGWRITDRRTAREAETRRRLLTDPTTATDPVADEDVVEWLTGGPVDTSHGSLVMATWDMPLLVWLGATNFLNCRNISIAPASTVRPERRRMERAGHGDITINTLRIFSSGSRSARELTATGNSGVPLTDVRGHVAHYGACCTTHEPHGLLFGKYEGRVWVPQHARGNAELGERHHDYELVPE